MNKELKSILNKAPELYSSGYYHLRYNSVKNYITDLEYKLYEIDEDELVEEAKNTYELVKRSNVRKSTLLSYKKEYNDIKEEYNQLKNHLKYIKGVE